MERDEFRAQVRKYHNPKATPFESVLWGLAELAPLGGRIWPEPNPYMLRAYLSPRDPQFRVAWKLIQKLEPTVGIYKPEMFNGVPHVYLHHFFRGDADEGPHNHPWAISSSIILTGGYLEERWDREKRIMTKREFKPGDINVIRRDDFHRVTLSNPERGCWTLFFSRNRVEEKTGYDWGFLDTATDEVTPWGPYTAARNQGAAR